MYGRLQQQGTVSVKVPPIDVVDAGAWRITLNLSCIAPDVGERVNGCIAMDREKVFSTAWDRRQISLSSDY